MSDQSEVKTTYDVSTGLCPMKTEEDMYVCNISSRIGHINIEELFQNGSLFGISNPTSPPPPPPPPPYRVLTQEQHFDFNYTFQVFYAWCWENEVGRPVLSPNLPSFTSVPCEFQQFHRTGTPINHASGRRGEAAGRPVRASAKCAC